MSWSILVSQDPLAGWCAGAAASAAL